MGKVCISISVTQDWGQWHTGTKALYQEHHWKGGLGGMVCRKKEAHHACDLEHGLLRNEGEWGRADKMVWGSLRVKTLGEWRSVCLTNGVGRDGGPHCLQHLHLAHQVLDELSCSPLYLFPSSSGPWEHRGYSWACLWGVAAHGCFQNETFLSCVKIFL